MKKTGAWLLAVALLVSACGDGRGPSREAQSLTETDAVAAQVDEFGSTTPEEPISIKLPEDPAVNVAAAPDSADSPIVVDAGSEFACTPTAVWDGDGPIWCEEGPRIRLAGIAARETDGSCRPGHPCPSASAEEARDQLVQLLGGPRGELPTGHVRVEAPTMTCVSEGHARGSRTAAWCRTPEGIDLSCAMIGSGTASRWEEYDPENRCGKMS